MYSQNEQPKKCKDCSDHGVVTFIKWVTNPEKPGINPNTGRNYMMPLDINTGQRHQCQFYQPKQQNANFPQQTGYNTSATTQTISTPKFTPNDKTAEGILKALETMGRQNDTIISLLEIVAGEKAAQDMKRVSELNDPATDDIPPEHKAYRDRQQAEREQQDYQNRTAYKDT